VNRTAGPVNVLLFRCGRPEGERHVRSDTRFRNRSIPYHLLPDERFRPGVRPRTEPCRLSEVARAGFLTGLVTRDHPGARRRHEGVAARDPGRVVRWGERLRTNGTQLRATEHDTEHRCTQYPT
jgi:hypothetical protein